MQNEPGRDNQTFAYYAPDEVHGQTVAEFLQILCIFVGIGTTPLLSLRFPRFWIMGLALGLITCMIGLWLVVQIWRGKRNTALRQRLAALWYWFRRWRTDQEPTTTIASTENNMHTAVAQPAGKKHHSVLPLATIFIGFFTIILAGVTAYLQRLPDLANEHLIAIYYSAPAILLWIAAEIVYLYPFLIVKPKRWAEISGIGRSLTKVISALLLWVYLGLETGLDNIYWMYLGSMILALISLLLGQNSRRQMQNRQHDLKRQQKNKVTVEIPQTTN